MICQRSLGERERKTVGTGRGEEGGREKERQRESVQSKRK